jgi:hypothetical protein
MTKTLAYISVLIFLMSVLLWSCEKEVENPEPTSPENEYFPLVIGNSISYQIQEINIDVKSAVNDTINYQIKERIDSLVETTSEFKSYRLERLYRADTTKEWVILNIWQIRQYQRRIHKIEENYEYVRLLTPTKLNDDWDGNKFNIKEENSCIVDKIQDSLINQIQYKIAYITHLNQSSLIDKKFSEEQYAKNIGLISKTIIDVELNIDPSLPWEDKVTKGTQYYQKIIANNE